MGSLFNNSYNWDQYQNDNALFKKGPLSSSGSGRTGGIQPSGQQQQQGEVFEDNLCVQMKKKELGISASEYDMHYNTQDGRHSPQIERLVREILAQEISDMAAQLAISMGKSRSRIPKPSTIIKHTTTMTRWHPLLFKFLIDVSNFHMLCERYGSFNCWNWFSVPGCGSWWPVARIKKLSFTHQISRLMALVTPSKDLETGI